MCKPPQAGGAGPRGRGIGRAGRASEGRGGSKGGEGCSGRRLSQAKAWKPLSAQVAQKPTSAWEGCAARGGGKRTPWVGRRPPGPVWGTRQKAGGRARTPAFCRRLGASDRQQKDLKSPCGDRGHGGIKRWDSEGTGVQGDTTMASGPWRRGERGGGAASELATGRFPRRPVSSGRGHEMPDGRATCCGGPRPDARLSRAKSVSLSPMRRRAG